MDIWGLDMGTFVLTIFLSTECVWFRNMTFLGCFRVKLNSHYFDAKPDLRMTDLFAITGEGMETE